MSYKTPTQLLASFKAGIRAECSKQGIDENTRRALMMRLAGVDTSKDLTLKTARLVLDHLRKTGGAVQARKKPNEWGFVFRQTPEKQKFLRKIYRLAQKLGERQPAPVDVMTKKYIEGIATQMAGATQPLEFCDCARLHKIVQALEVHLGRFPA